MERKSNEEHSKLGYKPKVIDVQSKEEMAKLLCDSGATMYGSFKQMEQREKYINENISYIKGMFKGAPILVDTPDGKVLEKANENFWKEYKKLFPHVENCRTFIKAFGEKELPTELTTDKEDLKFWDTDLHNGGYFGTKFSMLIITDDN